jgi:hypothetical protein
VSCDRVFALVVLRGLVPWTGLLRRCVRMRFTATRPGLVPADEFLLVDAKRNQKRLLNVHPCLRTPSLSTRCVHHSGVLNTPNRRSPDWHRYRPGMRTHAQTGADARGRPPASGSGSGSGSARSRSRTPGQSSVKCLAKDASCFRMPGRFTCQSVDRRFGVLRTPERRAHRVGGLGVRRHGWTFEDVFGSFWRPPKGPRLPGRDPAGWQSVTSKRSGRRGMQGPKARQRQRQRQRPGP